MSTESKGTGPGNSASVENQKIASKTFVTFWGTRGSISTPGANTEKYGGNTPCISIQHEKTMLIFDAGTGIRNLGLYLIKQNSGHNLHLFLSHTHWDHIQGLPFFMPAYSKDVKITIYGSPNKEQFLESILSRQMDVNYFPVDMNALSANISIKEIHDQIITIDKMSIEWDEQVCHPGGSVRYRIKTGNTSVIYATDLELNKMGIKSKDQDDEQKEMENKYRKFIHGADLLIGDGQYTEQEYISRRGWGHSSVELLTNIAYEEEVKQLAVFHHDPLHSDSMLDKLWSIYSPKFNAKEPPMNIFWAREGMTIAV